MIRKLKILGIVIFVLALPFILFPINFIITFKLEHNFGVQNGLIPIGCCFCTSVILFYLLIMIFFKAKDIYIVDAYLAALCLLSAWIWLMGIAGTVYYFLYFGSPYEGG